LGVAFFTQAAVVNYRHTSSLPVVN